MAKPIITLIGLGLTGTSLGLGLQREEGDFEIVGHDKEPSVAQRARKEGAVQRTEWNLFRACDGADLIVLSVPLSEMAELLELIAEDVKPGTMILAMSPVMQPAIELGDKHLPEGVHFVAAHPILAGIGGSLTPRKDLFDDVTFCLSPSLQTDPDAVQLASDFVERVGAKPFFVDAQEHDGIIAGVEQLPQILAAALMRQNAESPSWQESRRLAGRRFAQSTELGSSAAQIFGAVESNRENLLVRVDQMLAELAEWRRLLTAEPQPDEEHPLLAALTKVVAEREQWEIQAELKRWDDTGLAPEEESKDQPGMLRQMFFGSLVGRRPGREKDG